MFTLSDIIDEIKNGIPGTNGDVEDILKYDDRKNDTKNHIDDDNEDHSNDDDNEDHSNDDDNEDHGINDDLFNRDYGLDDPDYDFHHHSTDSSSDDSSSHEYTDDDTDDSSAISSCTDDECDNSMNFSKLDNNQTYNIINPSFEAGSSSSMKGYSTRTFSETLSANNIFGSVAEIGNISKSLLDLASSISFENESYSDLDDLEICCPKEHPIQLIRSRCDICKFLSQPIMDPARLKIRKYHCDKCYKVYWSRHNLKKHVREIHDKTPKFQCEKCSRSFFQIEHLKLHRDRVHWQN